MQFNLIKYLTLTFLIIFGVLITDIQSVRKLKLKLKVFPSCKMDNFKKGDFKMDEMLNTWYPIIKTKTLPFVTSCYNLFFTKQDEGAFKAEVREKQNGASIFNFNLKNAGAPNTFNFSVMNATSAFVIADTDYKTYAVIYLCLDMMIAKQTHVLVLSREKTLAESKKAEIKKFISEKMGKSFNLEELNPSQCRQ